jgi:hypothetical protein
MSAYLNLLFTTVVTLLRARITPLRRDTERGAGGNTLEVLLLAVGGVIVASIVVIAVKSSIDSRTSQLNP